MAQPAAGAVCTIYTIEALAACNSLPTRDTSPKAARTTGQFAGIIANSAFGTDGPLRPRFVSVDPPGKFAYSYNSFDQALFAIELRSGDRVLVTR